MQVQYSDPSGNVLEHVFLPFATFLHSMHVLASQVSYFFRWVAAWNCLRETGRRVFDSNASHKNQWCTYLGVIDMYCFFGEHGRKKWWCDGYRTVYLTSILRLWLDINKVEVSATVFVQYKQPAQTFYLGQMNNRQTWTWLLMTHDHIIPSHNTLTPSDTT